jgi:hypothetical protein
MDVQMQSHANRLAPPDSKPGDEAGHSPGRAKPSAQAAPRAPLTSSSAGPQSPGGRADFTTGSRACPPLAALTPERGVLAPKLKES